MRKKILSILVSGCVFHLTAGSPSIGVVSSKGEIRVNGSSVLRNGSLSDGNLVETAEPSLIKLDTAQVSLAGDSRVRIYRDRTVLEKGSGVLRGTNRHSIEAAALQITPQTTESVVQVAMRGPTRLAVVAQAGASEVRNSSGVLLASMSAGAALTFDSDQASGAAAAVKLTGCLEKKDGKYLLTDVTSKVKSELQGPDLDPKVKKRIEVTGSILPVAPSAPGASQVVSVAKAEVQNKGCSSIAPYAIIGGVAIAATIAIAATRPAASTP